MLYIMVVQQASTAHFVRRSDEWRTHLKLSHTAFLQYVGRAEQIGLNPAQSEWGSLRAGRRMPSASFVRLVLGKARAADPVWADMLEAAYAKDTMARVA